jgi:hypothetical protein
MGSSKQQTANSKQPDGDGLRQLEIGLTLGFLTVCCLLFAVCFQNKKSRAKQRGTSVMLKFFGIRPSDFPELFSRLFYVAASRLNSPRFPVVLIRRSKCDCQAEPAHEIVS